MKKKYCTNCFQYDGCCNDASNIEYEHTARERRKYYLNDCDYLNRDNNCENFISKELAIITLLIISSAIIILISMTLVSFLL